MGHIASKRSRFEKTEPRWLAVGGQLNELANGWASRDDIVTFVGEGAGGGAPACFVPHISEMEVDVTAAFGEEADPRWIADLTERDVQFDYPVAMGAVLHEAMHAKHSKWDLPDCAKRVRDRFEHDLITAFEETRIEARGVGAFPENRAFLRACALHLVVGDLKEDEDFAAGGHQSFSKLMLLSMARVDAGVLKHEDVRIVSDAAEKLYGAVLVAKLRALWCAAQFHSQDAEWEPLHALALQWIKLLEDEGHDPRKESEAPQWLKDLLEAMMGAPVAPGGEDGAGSSGSGDGGEDGDEDGEGAGGMLQEMADAAETAARGDAADQDLAEQAAAMSAAAQAGAKERKNHQDTATRVFGAGTGPASGATSSRLEEKREPTGPERAAAVALSKALERAQYRDRVVERRRSAVPPGRLKMRSAMAGAAETSRGADYSQEPWDAKRRFHTEDPELKVAVMVDISGSMRRAMQPMAGLAWILSEAVRRVQGKAAMVYYGNDVFPTLAPGQHLDKVSVYSAADMTEKFDRGFKALNGKLDLLGSTGARLLVIVSDVYYTEEERERFEKWTARCRREGVAVIVVAPSISMQAHAQNHLKANGTVLVLDDKDAVGTARAIGQAAVNELARASR